MVCEHGVHYALTCPQCEPGPAAPAPDAGPVKGDKVGNCRACGHDLFYEEIHRCAIAPRPDAAVDQHREGDCDCCDEWRRAMDAQRARADAAEETVSQLREWHTGALNAAKYWRDHHRTAEARVARMEAALRNIWRELEGLTGYGWLRNIVDRAFSPAPPEGPCVHGIPVARCAWCAVQGPEGDGDLRGLLREAVQVWTWQASGAEDYHERKLAQADWLRRARAALGKEADGDGA